MSPGLSGAPRPPRALVAAALLLVAAFVATAVASELFIDRPFVAIGPHEWVQNLTHSTSRFLSPEEAGLTCAALAFLLPAMLILARSLTSVEAWDPTRWLDLDERGQRRVVLALVALSVALAAACRFLVLRGNPIVDDERSYLFEAHLLASGRASLPAPPAALGNPMMLVRPAWTSKYPPGQALVLLLGALAGAPWLMPLAITALCVLGVYVFARDQLGARAALAATALAAVCPSLVVCGATALSFGTTACAVIWCLAALSRAERTGRPAWNAAAGACLGATFLLRPLDACALAIAAMLLWARTLERREVDRPARALAAFAAGFTPLAAVLPLWNWRVFGSPWRLGYTEAQDYLFGFGVHPLAGVAYVHTPVQAIGNLMVSLVRLDLWLLAWPASLALVLVGLASRVTGRMDRAGRVFIFTHVVLSLLIASGGIRDVGAAYMIPLAPLLIAYAARGLRVLLRAGALGGPWRRMVAWTVVLGCAVNLALVMPLRMARLGALAAETLAPWRAIASSGIGDAIVALPDGTKMGPVGYVLGYPYEIATGPATRARLCRPLDDAELAQARAYLGPRLPVFRLTFDRDRFERTAERRYALVPVKAEADTP